VPTGTNFLKCNHCGQQLAVRRSDSATFTEAADRLTQTTEDLAEQVEELTQYNKLAELDRRWQQQREDFMVTTKHGHRRLPNEGGALIGGVVIVVFGCIWTAMACGITSMAPDFGPFGIAKIAFPAFGLLFIVFGATTSIRHYQMAKQFREANRRYLEERNRLADEEM